MTLDEAIKYHEELSSHDSYQKQLVKWLKELRELRRYKSFTECPDTMGK